MIEAYLMTRGKTITGGVVKRGRVGENPYRFPKGQFKLHPNRVFVRVRPVAPPICPRFSQLTEMAELTGPPKLPEWGEIAGSVRGWSKVIALGATPYVCALILLFGQIRDKKATLGDGKQLRLRENQVLCQKQLDRVQQETKARAEQTMIARTWLGPQVHALATHRPRQSWLASSSNALARASVQGRSGLGNGRRTAGPSVLIIPSPTAQPTAIMSGRSAKAPKTGV